MFEQVKQEIDDKIKTNGNNEITANRLNSVLQDMMDASAEVIDEVQQSIGDQVEANPTGAATDSLEKIKIGEEIYEIPEGIPTNMDFDQKLQTQANINNQESSVAGRLGYVVLQPEKQGDATTSFATQIANKPNTIFEIRDVFTGDAILPKNCVLKFNGGMLDNMNLTGSDTDIVADAVQIFGENFHFRGTWTVKESYPEWFGAKADGADEQNYTDNTSAFQRCLNAADNFCRKIKASGDNYRFDNELTIVSGVELEFNRRTKISYYGTGDFITFGRLRDGQTPIPASNIKFKNGQFISYDENCGNMFTIIYLYNAVFENVGVYGAKNGFSTFDENYYGSYYVYFLTCTVASCRENGFNMRPYVYLDNESNLHTQGQNNQIQYIRCATTSIGTENDADNGNGFLVGGTAISIIDCTSEQNYGYGVKVPLENSIQGLEVNGMYTESRPNNNPRKGQDVFYIAADYKGTSKRTIHICGLHNNNDQTRKGVVDVDMSYWYARDIFVEGFYEFYKNRELTSCVSVNDNGNDWRYKLEGIPIPCKYSYKKNATEKTVILALGIRIGNNFYSIKSATQNDDIIARSVSAISGNSVTLDSAVPSGYTKCNLISKEHPLHVLGSTYLLAHPNLTTGVWGYNKNFGASYYTGITLDGTGLTLTLTTKMQEQNPSLAVGDVIYFSKVVEYDTIKTTGTSAESTNGTFNIPESLKEHPFAKYLCVLVIPNRVGLEEVAFPSFICVSMPTTDYDGAAFGVKRRGLYSERPSSADIYDGFVYFCTDKGKEIVWNGSSWVNTDGTPLQQVYTSQPADGMLPNMQYNFGTLAADKTFLLDETNVDTDIPNVWYWTFEMGATVYNVIWPTWNGNPIEWAGGILVPDANKKYEITVANGIAAYIEI